MTRLNDARHFSYSTPSKECDGIVGVQPTQNIKIPFIDITNEGLLTGLTLNQNATNFWTNMEQRTMQSSTEQRKGNKNKNGL